MAGVDSVAAAQATAEEAAAWALAWLNGHAGWLVAFDNVEQAAHVEPYLAQLGRGHVLITTRRDIGRQHRGIVPLRLGVLSRQASISLLADLLGPATANQTELLDELADELGDLPLALMQAGAYITRTPRVTPARYLQLLGEAPARMHAAVPVVGDAARVAARTWSLSHERIRTVDPLAARLLHLLACYAPDSLPCSVLDGLDDMSETVDSVRIGEALALLASYSLITLTTDAGEAEDLISVHRLVQATTMAQLTEDRRDAVRRQAAALLEAALPEDPERSAAWPAYRRLLPHARAALPPDSIGLVLVREYLSASGNHITALNIQHQIYAHHLSTSGAEHPGALNARDDLASLTGQAGDVPAARDQLAALLLVRERVLGAEHRDILTTRYSLAYWTGKTGDAAAARDQLAALLPAVERVLGAQHCRAEAIRADLVSWTAKATL